MAPAFTTIPDAPADEAAPLTAAPQSKTSIKGLVAGAAVASFVLGLMAATAVTSAAAPRAPAAFHSSWTFELQDNTTSKHFNGHDWSGWCINHNDN